MTGLVARAPLPWPRFSSVRWAHPVLYLLQVTRHHLPSAPPLHPLLSSRPRLLLLRQHHRRRLRRLVLPVLLLHHHHHQCLRRMPLPHLRRLLRRFREWHLLHRHHHRRPAKFQLPHHQGVDQQASWERSRLVGRSRRQLPRIRVGQQWQAGCWINISVHAFVRVQESGRRKQAGPLSSGRSVEIGRLTKPVGEN